MPEQLPFGQYIKGVRNDVTFTASPQSTGPVQKVIFEFVGLNSQTLARFEDSSPPFQVQYNVGDLPVSTFGKHPSLFVTPVVDGVDQCPSLFDIEVIPDPMTSSDFLQPLPHSRTWWDAGIQSYRFQASIPYIEGVLPASYNLGNIPFLGEINNTFNTGISVNGTLNLEGKARLYVVQAFVDAVVLGYPVLPEGDGTQDLTPPGISNVEFDYRDPSQISVPFKVTLVEEPLITIGATKVLVFTYFGIVNAYINGQLVFGIGVYLEGQVQPLVPAVDATMTGSGSLAAELGLSADLLFGLIEGGAGLGGAVCINVPLHILVSTEPDVSFLSPTVGGKLYIVSWASAFWGLYKTRNTTTIANFGAGCGGLIQRASVDEDELIPPEFFVAPVVAASPGGRILSAYVENTAPPGETEKVQIMARFQEPGSTVWSAPQAISNPAHSAQAPAVAFVGPNQIPVVAWSEITLTAAEAAALGEDINGHTKHLEIFYALWQDDGWGQPIALTNNLLGEGLPEIAGTSNGGVLAWTRDLDGDIATRSDQRIAVSLFNLGTKTFDAPDLLSASVSGLNNDVSVAYDTNGPTPIPYIAWVYDADGDLLTADDRRLALAYRDGVNWVLLNPQPLPPRVDSPAITVTPTGVEVAFLVREPSPDGSVGVIGVNGVLWRAKLVAGKWIANPLLDERGKIIHAEQPVIQSLQDETLLVFRRFDNSSLVTNLGQISLSRIVANEPPSSPLYLTDLPEQKWSASVAINPITNEAIIVNSSVSLLPREAETASLDGVASTQAIATTNAVQLGSATHVVEALTISVGSDPALDPLAASSQAPNHKSPIIVAATVRNVGRGTASSLSVSLYLGSSASGTLIGTKAVSGTLNFNEIQTLYFTVAPQIGEFSLFAQLSSGGQNLSTANDSVVKTLGTLSAPSRVNMSASMEFENGLTLAWSGNPGEYISGYRILRSGLPNDPWELVGEAAGPNFTDTLVVRGKTYCYAIQAYNGNTLSPQGQSSCAELPLLPLYLPKVKR